MAQKLECCELQPATIDSVAVLDSTVTEVVLKGFIGSFSDGTYSSILSNDHDSTFMKVACFNIDAFGCLGLDNQRC